MKNTKFCAVLLVLVILVGVFSLPAAISSLMNRTVIESIGEITTSNIAAKSGSARDIQLAVDAVVASAGVGSVFIPAGTFNFVEVGEPWVAVWIPAGVNVFGATTERDGEGQVVEWRTVLVMPYDVPGDDIVGVPSWFRIVGNGDVNKPSRFSDVKLAGYRDIDSGSTSMHSAMFVENVIDFRIDHCFFKHTSAGIHIMLGSRGVIDHCKLVNEYGTPTPYETRSIGYGVHVANWPKQTFTPIEQVLGQYTDSTVFIEDCYFEKWRHNICTNNGGHIVFRHNTISNDFGYGTLDQHQEMAYIPGRALEIYGNQLLNPMSGWGKDAIWFRGGGGVVFNNTVTGYDTFVYLSYWTGIEDIYQPRNIWVWDNSLPSGVSPVITYGNISEGINYWLHAPHTFDYQPYPYPHPLTLDTSP